MTTRKKTLPARFQAGKEALLRHTRSLAAGTIRVVLLLLRSLESVYRLLITDRRWFVAASAAAEDYWSKRMYYYTGNFTYNAFLAVIALLVALSALAGMLARAGRVSDELIKALRNVAPIFGATPERTLDAMRTYRNVAGIIGLAGLMWTGTRIFSAMEWGFCMIWGTKKRSYAKKKAFGLLLISVIGTLFLVAFAVQFSFRAFWDWALGTSGILYEASALVTKPLLGFAVNFALFLLIFKLVPTARNSWRAVLPGAAVSSALFLVTQYLLTFYFSHVSRLPSVYGSLSTVLILLIWLHITGMITFFGAEIIYVTGNEDLLEEHRKRASAWNFIPRPLRGRVAEEGGRKDPGPHL